MFTFLNYHTACVVVMNERTRKYLFSATLNMNSFNRKTQWSAIKLYLSIVQVLLDMFQHFDSWDGWKGLMGVGWWWGQVVLYVVFCIRIYFSYSPTMLAFLLHVATAQQQFMSTIWTCFIYKLTPIWHLTQLISLNVSSMSFVLFMVCSLIKILI